MTKNAVLQIYQLQPLKEHPFILVFECPYINEGIPYILNVLNNESINLILTEIKKNSYLILIDDPQIVQNLMIKSITNPSLLFLPSVIVNIYILLYKEDNNNFF